MEKIIIEIWRRFKETFRNYFERNSVKFLMLIRRIQNKFYEILEILGLKNKSWIKNHKSFWRGIRENFVETELKIPCNFGKT